MRLLSELLPLAIAGRMQKNLRSVQATVTSQPFTITRAAMNRHIILSADNNWLKQGPVNQPRGHLSASLSCPEDSEKYFEEFQVSCKMLAANGRERSTQENTSCVK